jgi:hypothetical protein
VTIPAPVITTRGVEALWQETGKSTNPIPIVTATLKDSQDKSNAALAYREVSEQPNSGEASLASRVQYNIPNTANCPKGEA